MARLCRLCEVLRRTCFAILLFALALVGAFVGIITGGVIGQVKEIGFLNGAAVGAFSGVILSMEVLESMVYGRTISLEAILFNLLNGRVFTEWVMPAIETAYQYQVYGVDTSSGFPFNIYSPVGKKGLLQDSIQKLQLLDISYEQKHEIYAHQTSCAICLQDFTEGDAARRLPKCKHTFHTFCIDKWLVRRGCCPICRSDISV